ncbi:hypothetical protein ACS0TY_020562 [Phlomoides rotata]
MSLSKDLVFLILQFCDEENLKKTAHMLEQETGYYFDLKYFEELVIDGNWDEAEKYLTSFTVVEDNKYSTKIYFEIRKQKFLEALDKHEFPVALDILLKDLKVFSKSNKELYKEMAQLMVLDDIRENSSLASYGDTLSARKRVVDELRTVVEANPLLQEKTRFPQINKSRLRRLINQSLNWQHIQCTHPHPQPHIDTLFTDHKCPGPDNIQDQLNKNNSLLSTGMALSDQFTPAAVNLRKLSNQTLGESSNCPDASNLKSINPFDEVASPADCSSHCQGSADEIPSVFPKTVERILNVGSSVTTMDFHPVLETLLLVGKSVGDIQLWDVVSAEKLFTREFTVEEANDVSGVLSEKMESKHGVSVNRVRWSPGGSKFGAAFSEHIIHLYNKNGDKQFEINAHFGSVNDIAFSKPYDKLVVISCGDDKLIQVWDAETGAKQYTFEGHQGPVYSLCPHLKECIHFLFSISRSGEIKAWLFDNCGSRITYNAPGLSCMRMAYSSNSKRLFSCGTNENGESYIVEWSESEGFILRTYSGLSKYSSGMVRFDTTINRYLAAGDDHVVKIWDMDKTEILAVVDADGGLPASPYICFNEKGNLLAVSTDDNRIKILANEQGRELLQIPPSVSYGCLTESFRKFSLDTSVPFVHQAVGVEQHDTTTEETLDALEKSKSKEHIESTIKMEMPNISQIVEVPRCQSILLTSEAKTSLIRRLVYTHAGNGILALAEDGTHLLWRWVKSADNLRGEATMKCAPQLFQPKNGSFMMNDLPDNSSDVVTPCLSLSKNDSYVISASGRMINLYNMVVFRKIRTVMPSPPAATCLQFYPQDNNIIAIGMDDATILIYNIRVDELISKLEGHSKRISGLAFSTNLNVLVSCGVDTQIVLWDSVTWEKKKSTVLQISVGWTASDLSETNIELDKDEKHFLAVHETQLAIYETTTLRRVKQWTISNFCTRISHATYSCDSELVYAVMRDGILLILGASDLAPRFEIDPFAYLSSRLISYVDPVVVAAHPHKPYQFALGLSNGGVVVMEPLESQGKWAISSH